MIKLLKFITCGSVDDGKSTLIGNILYNSKLLYADQEETLILDSKVGSRGGAIDYSLLLDGLMAEREQGITIDVAYRYFTTNKRSFIVADTPGHEEYTRNMAVGASFAEVAILLLDVTKGVLVQTRRHARICSMVGIRHFVFAINKMDLANYDEKKFDKIVREIEELAIELNLENIKIIPVSATEGDNVTKKSGNMDWYKGESILEYLETVDVTENDENSDFYILIQRVCRPNHEFRGFQGQIESGIIKTGEEIVVLPSNEIATVKTILNGDRNVKEAFAGQAVTIQLDREVDVSRGSVITNNKNLRIAKSVEAVLLWMDDDKLAVGKEYLAKLGTKKIPAVLQEIVYKIDVNTGEKIDAQSITKNEIALCKIKFSDKVIVDLFKKNKVLGELIIIDRLSHQTAAAGVVEKIDIEGEKPYFEKDNIKIDGYIFEELYFDFENARMFKEEKENKTYHVGDKVSGSGDSFEYPEYFDIISLEGNAAVLIRNYRIFDIVPLEEYHYTGLPMLDEAGFGLQIKTKNDMKTYLSEYRQHKNRLESHKKWAKFEIYRKVVSGDNFYMI